MLHKLIFNGKNKNVEFFTIHLEGKKLANSSCKKGIA